MKRFNKHWNKMYESEDGKWISFEDYDIEMSGASSQNESMWRVNEELHKDVCTAESVNAEFSRVSLNLERHIQDRDEMLIEKAKVIVNLCDQSRKQDVTITKLQNKIRDIMTVIWFGLIPTIIGLTLTIFITNW